MLLSPPLHSDVNNWHADVGSPCWCQPQMGLNWKFHGLLSQWDLILLPHPGCCSLPTAPVVAAYWILPLAADPAVALVYICMHACHSSTREHRHLVRVTSSSDDVGLYSASGASSFCCAYCQASPAALVDAPFPVASLLSLDHLIWSNIHGVMNFRVIHAFSILLSKTRNRLSAQWAKCERNNLGWWVYSKTVLDHVLYLAKSFRN